MSTREMISSSRSAQPVLSSLESTLPSRTVAWVGVALLTAVYACSFVDRQIMTLLVEPIKKDLAITDTGVSLLHGFAFALLYAACGIPIGRWVDRGVRPAILALGVLAWSACTMLCGFARNFAQLFMCRVGVGVGEAAVVPSTYSLLADYFPRERRGIAVAAFGIGVYAGLGLALIIGGMIVSTLATMADVHVPIMGLVRPWKLAFLVVGAVGLPLAALTLLINEPRKRSRGPVARAVVPWSLLRQSLARARGALISHHLSTAFIAMGLYSTLAWAPEYFRRSFAEASSQAGVEIGFVVLMAGTVGVVTGGAFSDWLLRRGYTTARLLTLLLGGLLAAPFALAFGVAPSKSAALILLGGALFFMAMLTAAGPAGVQELYSARARGFGSAVFQLVVNLIGLGLGPTAVALMSDRLAHTGLYLGKAISSTVPSMLVFGAIVAALGIPAYRRSVHPDS